MPRGGLASNVAGGGRGPTYGARQRPGTFFFVTLPSCRSTQCTRSR